LPHNLKLIMYLTQQSQNRINFKDQHSTNKSQILSHLRIDQQSKSQVLPKVTTNLILNLRQRPNSLKRKAACLRVVVQIHSKRELEM